MGGWVWQTGLSGYEEIIMNRIERILHGIGRAIGSYKGGIDTAFSTSGTRPQLTDETAWSDPFFWGAGLSDKKPRGKADYVNYFAGWTYICAKRNGQSVAINPLRLYVAKETKGQQYRTIGTKPVKREKLKYLCQNQSLDPWLTKAEEVEEVTEHPLLDLMQNVNPYNNSFDLWELTGTFLDLTGEAYWYIPSVTVDKSRIPQQIWVIPAQHINPKFGDSLNDAIKYYEYKRGNAEAKFKTEDVIMFTYPNPHNVFTGFSVIRGIADAVYLQRQMNEFETSIMENRARVGGIIEETQNISRAESERVKQKLKQSHAGPKNAGKDLYLPGGLKYSRSAMTPEEINFTEGRRLNRTEIMAAHDIPEGVIITESSNRAVAEAAGYQHAKYGILPRCRRIEEKLNERLLPRFDERLFVAFDDPVPEDKEKKLLEDTEHVKTNIKLINEVREENGLEPVPWGDVAWMDSQLVPIDENFDEEPEEPEMPPETVPSEGEEEEEENVETLAKKAKNRLKEMLG